MLRTFTATRLTALVAIAVAGCSRPSSGEAAKADPAPSAKPVTSAPPPHEDSLLEKSLKAKSMSEAIKVATPHFEDKMNQSGDGTLMFAAWARKSMTWSDVGVEKDETSYALVMKDAEEERGKRLCVPGNIIEIEVMKSDIGKVHDGLLSSDARNLFKFIAVGSTGKLVERSRTRFCGVVTGRFDYSNSGGGTGHAVKMVGMFDLPENKSPTAAL